MSLTHLLSDANLEITPKGFSISAPRNFRGLKEEGNGIEALG
jgi:hypothetical protein